MQTEKRWPSWFARLAVIAFLLIGYSYYEGCKTIGMFVAWSFLVGFPFAFPLTFLAVRAALKERRAWIIVVWTALAFTMFFWSAQALLLWKASA